MVVLFLLINVTPISVSFYTFSKGPSFLGRRGTLSYFPGYTPNYIFPGLHQYQKLFMTVCSMFMLSFIIYDSFHHINFINLYLYIFYMQSLVTGVKTLIWQRAKKIKKGCLASHISSNNCDAEINKLPHLLKEIFEQVWQPFCIFSGPRPVRYQGK